jgi:hypothetical protein
MTFSASADFSSTQGSKGWFYRDSQGALVRFETGIWKGPEDYLWLWGIGGHPGATRDAVRRLVVPQSGSARITGTVSEQQAGCGDGVVVSILHRGAVLWRRDRPKGSPVESFDLTVTVAGGDALDFVIGRRGNSLCDTTQFDPTVVLSGSTSPPAANPPVAEPVPEPAPAPQPAPLPEPAPAPALPPAASLTFQASAGFSNTQGKGGWYYRDSVGPMKTFNGGSWKGPEDYLWLWGTGGHPGATRDAVRRFVVPQSGSARITATITELQAGCGDGVTVKVLHGSVILWQRDRPKGSPAQSFDVTASVTTGDTIDFVIGRRGNSQCDTTGFDPLITLAPGGLPAPPTSPPPASSPTPARTLTFKASTDFSGTQGKGGWYYRDSRGQITAFSGGVWKGVEEYLWLWGKGGHPGATRDAVRRFVIPEAGSARITATITDQNTTCGDGVAVSVVHRGTILWRRDRPNGAPPESIDLTAAVTAGDTIDFIIGKRGDSGCDTTEFDPTIVLTVSP